MIHKIIKYESFDNLNKIIVENKFLNYKELLIQVFAGIGNGETEKLIYKLHELLPTAKIIGASAYNGIINDEITLGETIISFSCFEKTKIQNMLVDTKNMDMYSAGIKIAKELIKNDTKLLLVFSYGDFSNKNYNVDELMKGIGSVNSKIIVAGGAASSSSKSFTTIDSHGINFDTFVFNEKVLKKEGIVAAALSGDSLEVTSGFNLGWKTIGREMKVTKAKKDKWLSRVYTIDNIPVLDLYEKYFGKELSRELLSSVLTLSFVIIRNGVEIDATPIQVFEDKSIAYTADVVEGDSIWFGYGETGIIIEEAFKKAREVAKKKQEALFVYSCISRPATLGSYARNELAPFSIIAPVCGFCTNREFYTFHSKFMTLGKTLSYIALSENIKENNCESIDIKNNEKMTVQMKTSLGTYNMIQTVTAELEEDNKILTTLVEINSKILEYENLKNFLEYILDKSIKLIKVASHGAFFSINNENQLELVSLAGVEENVKNRLLNLKINLSDSIIWIKTEGKLDKTIVLEDIKEHSKVYGKSDVITELEETQIFLNKMIAVPIRIDDKFYGFITVDCHSNDSFSQKDIELMNFFAEGIAIVIKNKLLFDKTLILSKYDALTGITNRAYFEIILKEHMKNIEVTKETFSIAVFDINYLKKANDTHGHDVGDSLLKDFAGVVSEGIRKTDVFARFGGDEFALALFNLDKEFAVLKLKLLEKKVEEFNKKHHEKPYKISYSVGIASYPEDGDTLETLIKIADERMYENKKSSRS